MVRPGHPNIEPPLDVRGSSALAEREVGGLWDSLPLLVLRGDAAGSCDYVNRQWMTYTGTDAQRLLDHGWLAQVHIDDRDRLTELWRQAVDGGSEASVEVRIRRHDGIYRWFDTRAVPVSGAEGQRWLASSSDVTERRLAADARERRLASIETVISNMTEGLIISEMDGRIIHWNPACLTMHGFSSEEARLRRLDGLGQLLEVETLEGEPIAYGDWPLHRVFRGEEVSGMALRVRRRDMEWERVFNCSGGIVELADGTALAFLTLTDCTERDHALRALSNSEQRLRVANEVAGIGTYQFDYRTKRIRISPELYQIAGLPPNAELSLTDAIGRLHPADRERLQSVTNRSHGPTAPNQLRIILENGDMRWLYWSSRVLYGRGGNGKTPTEVIGACLDVTHQRLTQRRLTTHNAVNGVLAEAAELPDAASRILRAICEAEEFEFGAIWEVDEAAGVLRCSTVWHEPSLSLQAFAEGTRKLEFGHGVGFVGKVWAGGQAMLLRDVHTDPDYARGPLARDHGLHSALAFPIIAKGKVTGVIDFSASAMYGPVDKLLETVTPIGLQVGDFFERKRTEAERRELEKQLQQAQKMDALGQLSGGIAHDFNNVLTAILSNTEIALLEAAERDPIRPYLQAIEEASQRAKNLVWQILAFARQQPQTRHVIPIGPHVEESVRLLRATIPAGVELIVVAEADVPDVRADGTQLQQVFLNLVTNAWHALRDGRGRIVLEIADIRIAPDEMRGVPGLRPGRYARVTVKDNGEGIPAAVLDRVFEPFFTTKAPGRGTGLGLSVVHGIVRNHEGAIALESVVGAGTTVSVYFPAAEREPEPPAAALDCHGPGNGQRILFIDDERPLVVVAERALRRYGYEVAAFTEPERAIDAFKRDPDSFHIAVTDLNMPGLSGIEVASQLRRVRPHLPVLLLSGHIPDDSRIAALDAGIRHLVYKPYRIAELAEAVSAALLDASQAHVDDPAR